METQSKLVMFLLEALKISEGFSTRLPHSSFPLPSKPLSLHPLESRHQFPAAKGAEGGPEEQLRPVGTG